MHYIFVIFPLKIDTSVAVMRTLGNRLRFILQTGLHRGRDRGQIYNKEAFVQEVAANIIRTVSNLMSENKSMAWLDLKVPLRMKLINHLLLALEEVAFMLAEVTNTPEFLEEVAENLGEYLHKIGNLWGPIIYFIEGRSPSRHKWRFCI